MLFRSQETEQEGNSWPVKITHQFSPVPLTGNKARSTRSADRISLLIWIW